MAKRILYLLRHGQEDRKQRDDALGGPLTALGRKQAARAGKRLTMYPIQRIFRSDLRRAHETAQIVSAFLPRAPLRTTPLIREVVPNVPAWHHPYFDTVDPADLVADGARADAAFARFFRPNRGRTDIHELIVCHGNLIRYWMCKATQNEPRNWRYYDHANAGISLVQIYPDGVCQVLALNDTGHLPLKIQSYL
ncbi:MAG TPA: histidine phosphatase family protein [Thermoflexales bacterium]|nr:histidine phosphatase family protein [Thermoflexales bacterium]HQZ22452.1 histidine phosphatase family protein [Thermoflexales bacterium]HQZ99141.1 histidine phosphatase family protein [Thermoflexales bacterium]